MSASTNAKSYDLSTFRLDRILNNNTKSKTICVLGRFPSIETAVGDSSDQAIVVFEKKAFKAADVHTVDDGGTALDADDTANGDAKLHSTFFSSDTILKLEFLNDIYGNFECFPKPEINSIKVTIICPCTDKHIQKFVSQAIRIVQETPQLYKTVTEPRLDLEAEQFSLNWVYNILDHQKEFDRIIFEDPCKENGFILLPDLKWDGKTVDTFYAIAICHRHSLKSLRSLGADQLPLLRNIREKGVAAIKEKFGLDRSQLRIYIHYQPSFYHLHVHFTNLKHDAPGIFCERSHLLDTVIDNIELISDYYQRATLSFVLKESDLYYGKYLHETVTDEKTTINDTKQTLPDEPVTKKPKIDE